MGALAAFLGIGGALIGWFGVFQGRGKATWLRHRLLTERIRQFYFQFLIRWAHPIAAAATEADRQAVLDARTRAWRRFEEDYEQFKAGPLEQTLDDEDEERVWMIAPPAVSVAEGDPDRLRQLLDYCGSARIGGQRHYAEHVLRDVDGSLRPPRLQAMLIERTTFLCIAGVFLVHMVLALAITFGVDKSQWGQPAHVLAILLALGALAAKTFEEGLRPDQEVERMRVYLSRIRKAERAFNKAMSADGKLAILAEFESVAYWEMREFLRSHNAARFSL